MTLTYGNVEENGVGAVINPKSDIAKIQSGIAYIFSQKNKPNSANEENNILSVGTPELSVDVPQSEVTSQEKSAATSEPGANPEPEIKQQATIEDVNIVMPLLEHFIGKSQLSVMIAGMRGEEGQFSSLINLWRLPALSRPCQRPKKQTGRAVKL